MNDKAIIKIRRFDPSVDKEARYEAYEVPPEAWRDVKVIDTIRYIYENLDPTLSFREPCRLRLCGACTIRVNNKSVLACDTFSEKEMVLEPLPNHRLIKDLVVDPSEKEK